MARSWGGLPYQALLLRVSALISGDHMAGREGGGSCQLAVLQEAP